MEPEFRETQDMNVEVSEASSPFFEGESEELTRLTALEPVVPAADEQSLEGPLFSRTEASFSLPSDGVDFASASCNLQFSFEETDKDITDMDFPETADEDSDNEEEDMILEPEAEPNDDPQLVDKLLTDEKMSYSQVAKLLGEGTDESEGEGDVCDTRPSSTKMSSEDHAKEFEKELNEVQSMRMRRKVRGRRKGGKRLPAALQGLMGEANLNYAHGKYDEAIKMCLEVIRQCRHAPEPYHTLGMIYEEKNMINKSIQFLMMAAFLSPNPEEWEKLAHLSLHQLSDVQQAIFCWGKAIRANPENLDYHWARCDLYERIGEKALALKGYKMLLKYLKPDHGEAGLKLAKEIAKIYYENGETNLAQEALETTFKKYPTSVTAEDNNLLLEVLMHNKEYLRCIEALILYSGVKLVSRGNPVEGMSALSIEEQLHLTSECQVPAGMAIDLKVKLTVALVHANFVDLARPFTDSLLREDAEEFGDLYIDVAEAYKATSHHTLALMLLEPLLKTAKFTVAVVWLHYAECMHSLERLEEAVEGYQQVICLAPQQAGVRLTLCKLLQTLGRESEALLVLHEEKAQTYDSQLLFHRCKILYEQRNYDEYIATARLFLQRHLMHVRNRDEAVALLTSKKLVSKLEALAELRKNSKEPVSTMGPMFTGSLIPIPDQWDLFQQLTQLLFQLKRYGELEYVAISALGSKMFMKDPGRINCVNFLTLMACLYNRDYYLAFYLGRELILKDPFNVRYQNLLCFIISRSDDLRHNRFLIRMRKKFPQITALSILNGHSALVSGTYKYALAEYTQAFKENTRYPLIPLMIGLTYTHLACQKFSAKKHSLVIQACAFLNAYKELRSECQESLYNLGRAMHQMNLLPQAIHFYKMALECPLPPLVKEHPELDLTKEIAFNLCLIYKSTGACDLAKYYCRKYIIV